MYGARVADPKIEGPSYECGKELTIEIRVQGREGQFLLEQLGVSSRHVKAAETAEGTPVYTATVRPFARLTGPAYAKWIEDLLRRKLSEHWSYRW